MFEYRKLVNNRHWKITLQKVLISFHGLVVTYKLLACTLVHIEVDSTPLRLSFKKREPGRSYLIQHLLRWIDKKVLCPCLM